MIEYSLLGGGSSGGLFGLDLGGLVDDLLGGAGSGGAGDEGLIDLGIGLGGSGFYIDLDLLGGLLVGGNDIGVDLDLDGVIDGEVSVLSDGSLLQTDLDLLGGLGDDGIAAVDIDLDGALDLVLNLGDGDANGPDAGFVNVDLDLDGVLDGFVRVGDDGAPIRADLDLLGGLSDDGLLGVDLDLDGVLDVVVDAGGGDDPGGEDPGGEDPGGEDPGGEDPGGEDPGGEDPGGTMGFDLFRAYEEITRVSPTSPDAPPQEINLLSAIADSVDAGQITLEQAIWRIVGFADDTTSVATTSYQFFTGAIPREAGLDYLVNAPDTVNPTDINDAYYAQFNLENRYINFASNLGRVGEGQAFFQAEYGQLSFEQAVVKAYDEIFGFAYAEDNGVNTTAAINDILGRKAYFYQVAQERVGGDIEIAAKAGLVGYLLAEAVKAEFGVYGEGNAKFLFDLADGDAAFQVDMTQAYGPDTVAMLGQSETSPGMYDTVVA